MEKTLITDISELDSALKRAVKAAIRELNEETALEKSSDKLYTINQIRKRLGKSHRTIKKMVDSGLIEVTKSGLISEAAINKYLQKI